MRKRLIIKILVIIFIFSGFTYNKFPIINKNIACNRPFVFGSIEYVKRIQSIARKSGNRSALSSIMAEVNKNGEVLDNNVPENIFRFHKLVSSLIYKIGYVDMQTHYFRNKLNRVPNTLNELIRLNNITSVNRRWRLLAIKNSSYHMQGFNGEYNLKFLSYDGFCEAVYNEQGTLLNESNDPINMGTYNYAAGMPNIYAHGKFDVSPYLIWGNSVNSPEKGKTDINIGVKLALINYEKFAADVYIYRQNLFGMQQGTIR